MFKPQFLKFKKLKKKLKGKIAERGTHQELLQLGGQYKKAYELQKRGYQD